MSETEYYDYGHVEETLVSRTSRPEESAVPARPRERQRVANPDDPPVHRPPRGPHGPLPGPRELGTPGRVAIVQGQVFIVGVILIAQLWLVTDALFQVLSGHPQALGWLTLASGVGFAIALVVWLWPRRWVRGR
jgi:hypothetical protein